jgi:DNA (cytosine-5)-methyltransferase 1
MNPNLVVSLFPGIGMLDTAAEELGFQVFRGPDLLWGGNIREFHLEPGVFGGVIGSPPCSEFSSLKFLLRARGIDPKHGNMFPEMERVIGEGEPLWFLSENVPRSPIPQVPGYGVHSFVIDNHQFAGETQGRKRRISFGWRGGRRLLLPTVVALESPRREYAAIGGVGKSTVGDGRDRRRKTNRHRRGTSVIGLTVRSEPAFRELCRRQGLPEYFDLPGLKIRAKCQAVGNGVPMAMGRALFKAIRELLEPLAGR